VKVKFAHICDYALISAEGKLSMLGLFENLNAVQLPIQHALLYIVFGLDFSPSELKGSDVHVRISCLDEDGKELARQEAQFRIQGQPQAGERVVMPQVVPFVGITFNRDGRHNFAIWLNNQHQEDVGFRVQKAVAPGQTG
jgi:hypothetical protein